MADQVADKVKHIVLRVQQSALSNDVKASLYETMQKGIQDVVLGELVTHIPQEKLDELAAHPESITPDALIGLMESSVGDGEVLREAQQKILTALATIETILTKQHVA